jgi:pSer/pThr/pTyr-binding forkhead associated (FHA) protein
MSGQAGLPIEGGWLLEGADGAGNRIRLSLGDTELARSYLGLVIGRHPALCDRVVDDASVSRRHCRIGAADGRLFVEDLSSLNGTLLEDAPVERFKPAILEAGDRLTLGRVELGLRRLDEAQR